MKKPTRLGTLLLASTTLLFVAGSARAAELGSTTPYYEDDAWYDITEWMDGNDYNPTDEAWWRWDDEAYETAEDVATDIDSDRFGFNAGNEDDWFYDYYTPGYFDYFDDNGYIARTNYYDVDGDGLYDAYTSFTDWNADGVYDDYLYYTFSEAGNDSKQSQTAQKSKDSKPMALTGTIDKIKQVKVANGEHTVVAIKPQDQQQQGQPLVADLGKSSELQDLNLKQGAQVTVTGPKSKVGDKQVVMARSIEIDGKITEINRQGRQITGKVVDTHKTQVRGREHLIAMVEIPEKEQQKAGKVAVDFGPAEKLEMDLSKGKEVTFSGVPVKVKDKRLVMARSIQKGDQVVQIDRQMSQQDQARTAGESQKPQDQSSQQQDQSQPKNQQEQQPDSSSQ